MGEKTFLKKINGRLFVLRFYPVIMYKTVKNTEKCRFSKSRNQTPPSHERLIEGGAHSVCQKSMLPSQFCVQVLHSSEAE